MAHALTRPTPNALRRSLPAPGRPLLDAAVAAASERGRTLWAVGGCVRDVARALRPREIDLALDGEVEPVARRAAAALALPAGGLRLEPRFGTASLELPGGAGRLDLSRLRGERYPRPGALPEVRFPATIEADLRRRDFTVNAVALLLARPGGRPGCVVDPCSGLADLGAGLLRALHPRSFRDDPTRLWRGARYAARLRLAPDPGTRRLIARGAPCLDRVSGPRLWSELERLAAERRAGAALELLAEWGALGATHPALAAGRGARRALARRPGPHPAALVAALLLAPASAGARSGALRRLAAPRGARLAAEGASELLAAGRGEGAAPPPAELERLAASTAEARRAALWLDPALQRPLQRELRRWERTRPPLQAGELVALGVEPGPELGRLLSRLRRERYLGTLRGAGQARARVRDELPAARPREGGGA